MKSVGLYNICFIQDALPQGVLGAECMYGCAAGYEYKFIHIEKCMQSLRPILQRDIEHEPVKHRHAIDLSETAGWA